MIEQFQEDGHLATAAYLKTCISTEYCIDIKLFQKH